MEWSNPELFNLNDFDGSKDCKNGDSPANECLHGGSKSTVTCWPGPEIAWEICVNGGVLNPPI